MFSRLVLTASHHVITPLRVTGAIIKSQLVPSTQWFVRNYSVHHEKYRDPTGERFSMTKIVGTIGPASESMETTQQLTDEGLRIMRINFSHAEHADALVRIQNLRNCRGVHWSPQHNYNLRAVLLDTKGPEIRTGKMEGGQKVKLVAGHEILLTTDPSFQDKGTASKIYISYTKLTSTVQPGDTILLSDGLLRLTVLEVNSPEVRCLINNTEELGNRKGVNLPGLIVDLPALSAQDRSDLAFGVQADVDFIAASFIRKPTDVLQIRAYVDQCVAQYWPGGQYIAPKIISKIENLEGIQNFDSILEVSDGIMVARGDLGVEIPLQKVLRYQKVMVHKCNKAGKPVIVATQMLESMIQNPRPTRAEVSDVGNAVLDGADAVMLSGEVANGKYPVESVRTMMTVIKEADQLLNDPLTTQYQVEWDPATSDVESVASSAVKTADEMKAKLLIVLTDTGHTARKVAKYKPTVPVMCFTPSKKIGRQLQLHRGLYPVVPETVEEGCRPTATEAIRAAKKMGWLIPGDRLVMLSADKISEDLGQQIVMRLSTVA